MLLFCVFFGVGFGSLHGSLLFVGCFGDLILFGFIYFDCCLLIFDCFVYLHLRMFVYFDYVVLFGEFGFWFWFVGFAWVFVGFLFVFFVACLTYI